MTRIITLRVPDEQVAAIDRLLAEGIVESRTAAYVAALDAWLRAERSRALDAAIIDGYTRIPPTAAEVEDAAEQADRSVAAEPW